MCSAAWPRAKHARANLAETTSAVGGGENRLAGLTRHHDDVQRVLDATDIVRVVGEHVSLRAKGREYVGLCPFHDDHDPSMCVVPHKQIFHCFVCGSGGSALNFVRKFHRMEFRESLEYLAQLAGIELAPRREVEAEADESAVSRADLIRANAAAEDFFLAILRHAEHGAEARAMIERRGISPETASAFGLGASPERWDGLLMTIRRKGLDERAFRHAGLLKTRDDGSFYDAFRGRLMFPIHDQAGRIVAFGGRQLRDDGLAKYINSEETPVFRKSQSLFGLHLASRSIQKSRTAILVEGYTDVIACHQAGLDNVVAAMGTALTTEHAAVLRRLCDTVVLVFDGDRAGQQAADRATEALFAEPLDVKICDLSRATDAKDPDELLKRPDGVDVLRQAVAASADLLAFRFSRLRMRLEGSGPGAISKAIEEEIQRLVSMGLKDLTPIRRSLVTRQVALVSGVDESSVARAIAATTSRPSPTKEDSQTMPSLLTHRESLLGCALCEPTLWERVPMEDRETLLDGHTSPASSVAKAIWELLAEARSPTLEAVLARLDSQDAEAAVRYERFVDQTTERSLDRLHRLWDDCVVTVLRSRALAAPANGEGFAARLGAIREHSVRHGPNRRTMPRPI